MKSLPLILFLILSSSSCKRDARPDTPPAVTPSIQGQLLATGTQQAAILGAASLPNFSIDNLLQWIPVPLPENRKANIRKLFSELQTDALGLEIDSIRYAYFETQPKKQTFLFSFGPIKKSPQETRPFGEFSCTNQEELLVCKLGDTGTGAPANENRRASLASCWSQAGLCSNVDVPSLGLPLPNDVQTAEMRFSAKEFAVTLTGGEGLEVLKNQFQAVMGMGLDQIDKELQNDPDLKSPSGQLFVELVREFSANFRDQLSVKHADGKLTIRLPLNLGDDETVAATIFVVGGLAAVAVPAFMKYMAAAEAVQSKNVP